MEFMKLMKCGFNPIRGFVIDPMHNIFLGVAKQLASFFFKKKWKAYPFSCYSHLAEIDGILEKIKAQVPHEFTRAPRGFKKNFAHYKGTNVSLNIFQFDCV